MRGTACGPPGVGKLPLAAGLRPLHLLPQPRGRMPVAPLVREVEQTGAPDVHFMFPAIVEERQREKRDCATTTSPSGGMMLTTPYFGLNHWLNEMDAENGQAIIYAKESDEIIRKLNLKSSEGGYKVTIV